MFTLFIIRFGCKFEFVKIGWNPKIFHDWGIGEKNNTIWQMERQLVGNMICNLYKSLICTQKKTGWFLYVFLPSPSKGGTPMGV